VCDKHAYQSYLIRLRPKVGNGPTIWLVSLENVQTGERQSFASLQALYEYLQQLTGGAPDVQGRDVVGENNAR